MTRRLVLFEDQRWRDLRPLTDVLPVPALAFGASSLGGRLIAAARLPLAAIEARAGVLAAWESAPQPAARPAGGDEAIVANAAALPGAWLDELLAGTGDAAMTSGGRICGARIPFAKLSPGLGRGERFEEFLRGLGLPERPCEASLVRWPWDLVEWNPAAIAADLAAASLRIEGDVHPTAVLLARDRIGIAAGTSVEPLAVLDAREGPIHVGPRAVIRAHTVVTGPCVIGEGTQLFGGTVGHSTIGPECRIAGEVESSVWQGYANKRHHGFVGNSAIGEWVNLGALTTTSNLKNNYRPVRVWVDGREVDSGIPRVGSILGGHAKTGIGTLLPTGASVGVGANLFGGGRFAPKQVPAFGWWDGETMSVHRIEEFLATARVAASRRGRTLSSATEGLLRELARQAPPN